jgi:hypothetical protein
LRRSEDVEFAPHANDRRIAVMRFGG